MFRFLLVLLAASCPVFISAAQKPISSLVIKVTDAETHTSLSGASVQLEGKDQGGVTDSRGVFRVVNAEVGNYVIRITYVGYQQATIREVVLESGKTRTLEVALEPVGIPLDEATVRESRPDAFSSVQAITTEQTLRYAASYLDPARITTSFPGVVTANDQANGLVIRGNNPNGMQWRLEGVEIVNPNHLSNAGTFSDRATQTGGGVNILSTQLLGTTYFMNGALPANYGNVLSGVMDMSFRNGNSDKHEFTAQAGLIGLDFAAEGPLKKGSSASYLANYRYSFTGILAAMGVDFGGESISFQDLSFKLNLPSKKAGEFSVFGLGGISSNKFKGLRDTTLWESQKDQRDINYENKMGALGVTHQLSLGKRTGWNSALVWSGLETERTSEPFGVSGSGVRYEYNYLSKNLLSFSTVFNHRISDSHRLKAGALLTGRFEKLATEVVSSRVDGLIYEPYASWQWKISDVLESEIGMHLMGFTYNNTHSLEPRAALRWQVAPSQNLSFSYAIQSQTQLISTYAGRLNPIAGANNFGLKPTRAQHFVLGYQYAFSSGSLLKAEIYYQDIFDVPVSVVSSSFSALNQIETANTGLLINKGIGRNKGIELSWQRFFANSWYALISGSVYSAQYKGSDGVLRDSRFNGGHTFSFTGGKELYRKNNSTWGINTRILWMGGFRDTPVLSEQSGATGQTIYDDNAAFTLKMKDYFRPDLRIYWKKNKSKSNRTIALDIQNVSGTENEAYSYYDTLLKSMVRQNQMGMVPVLSYRWEF